MALHRAFSARGPPPQPWFLNHGLVGMIIVFSLADLGLACWALSYSGEYDESDSTSAYWKARLWFLYGYIGYAAPLLSLVMAILTFFTFGAIFLAERKSSKSLGYSRLWTLIFGLKLLLGWVGATGFMAYWAYHFLDFAHHEETYGIVQYEWEGIAAAATAPVGFLVFLALSVYMTLFISACSRHPYDTTVSTQPGNGHQAPTSAPQMVYQQPVDAEGQPVPRQVEVVTPQLNDEKHG